MVQLVGICGSLRKSSLNRALLVAIAELMPEGSSLAIAEPFGDFPIFNSDLDDPPAVTAYKARVAAADGLVIAVPEYNYSIPGGLKNALDWLSRPPATSPMKRKPVGIVGAASGMSGTIRAQAHLRQMLLYSDAPCLSQPEVLIPRAHERFDASGRLTDESTRNLIGRFASAMVLFARLHGAGMAGQTV